MTATTPGTQIVIERSGSIREMARYSVRNVSNPSGQPEIYSTSQLKEYISDRGLQPDSPEIDYRAFTPWHKKDLIKELSDSRQ